MGAGIPNIYLPLLLKFSSVPLEFAVNETENVFFFPQVYRRTPLHVIYFLHTHARTPAVMHLDNYFLAKRYGKKMRPSATAFLAFYKPIRRELKTHKAPPFPSSFVFVRFYIQTPRESPSFTMINPTPDDFPDVFAIFYAAA